MLIKLIKHEMCTIKLVQDANIQLDHLSLRNLKNSQNNIIQCSKLPIKPKRKTKMNKQNTPRKPQTHFRATWAAVLPLYTTVKT